MTAPAASTAIRTADGGIAAFVRALSARTPTPGGGAAAAVTAALGCATGALAARYTTGKNWAAISAQAENLALSLDDAATQALALADADAAAFAAVGVARKAGDVAALATAERAAAAVPAELLALCALHASALRGFMSVANPQLLSDVKVALHLLAGAGRAAWQTLLVNRPDADTEAIARAHLAELTRAESALG